MPPSQALYCVQSVDQGKFLFVIMFVFLCVLSLSNLSDLALLQDQCASCKLSISLGCPPLDTGMMWSMQGLIGCGALRLMSIGLPHIPQTFSDLSNLFLFFSKAARCGPCLSGLIIILYSLSLWQEHKDLNLGLRFWRPPLCQTKLYSYLTCPALTPAI